MLEWSSTSSTRLLRLCSLYPRKQKEPLPLDPSQKLEYRSFFIRVHFVHIKQTLWRREICLASIGPFLVRQSPCWLHESCWSLDTPTPRLSLRCPDFSTREIKPHVIQNPWSWRWFILQWVLKVNSMGGGWRGFNWLRLHALHWYEFQMN